MTNGLIDEKWLKNQEARAELCSSVELPVDVWKSVLAEIRRLQEYEWMYKDLRK